MPIRLKMARLFVRGCEELPPDQMATIGGRCWKTFDFSDGYNGSVPFSMRRCTGKFVKVSFFVSPTVSVAVRLVRE